jgi:DNA-binding transcriptional MerR regulator
MKAVAADAPLRIGELARAAGTTTRTIRYYEELGLLAPAPEREQGRHRSYGAADVERLREIVRLKDLLGVTLDELKTIVQAEDARTALREEFHSGDVSPQRRTEILGRAAGHLDRQLELLRRRRGELDALESELAQRRERVDVLLAER